jgi:uncharacterized protein YggE
MTYLFLLLSFLFIGQAQPKPKPSHELALTVEGTVKLPADRIIFQINVNAEGSSPQGAYQLHKKREKALVNLLDKYNIKDKNIRYQPISISRQQRRINSHKDSTIYATRQQVNLTLSNFDTFEKIQIGLIQHNFDQFSSQFTSSKLKEGKDEALQAAIKKAKHKAHLIAKTAGVALGPITQIQYQQVHIFTPQASRAMKFSAAKQVSPGSLLKYKRMIAVSATITIHYALGHPSTGSG